MSAPGQAERLDPTACPTISVETAAKALGVSRAACYEYVRQGRLPVIRLSQRRLRIPTARFMREVLGIEPPGAQPD
jgi:excisionase family DNA binding protein